MSAVTCWKCVVKGRENNALFFFFYFKLKQNNAAFTERRMNLSFRRGWFVTRVEWLHTLTKFSPFSKNGLYHSPVLFFCCEMLIKPLLYYETMCSVVECPLKTTRLSISLSVWESRLHSSFSIVTGFVFSLRLTGLKKTGIISATRVIILDLLKMFCSLPGNKSDC